MKNKNVVFIFGAGASKAENAPTTAELLSKSFDELTHTQPVCKIKDFLQDFYYLDDLTQKELIPTFEEVLTTIDLAISKQDDLSHKWNQRELNKLRNHLLYCIAKILDKTLKNSGRIHRRFVESLFDIRGRNNNNTSFISLNYDLLLDNALIELYGSKDWDVDYGIDFRNFIDPINFTNASERRQFMDIPDEWTWPRKGKSIYLLKPHGSLNWLYCPNCNTIKITKKEKGVLQIWTEHVTCDKDQSLQTSLLIPPTWHKIYENPHLLRIWQKTKEVLAEADKAIFVGYSLPESDTELKYLFKKFLYRFKVKSKPEITLVTKKSENTKKTELRFKRTFGKDVQSLTEGFEVFVENLENHLKE